jgi:hypothetical protein
MTVSLDREPVVRGSPARVLNVLLGIWLFISAFAWPHAGAERTNTWLMGVLTVIFALVSMAQPSARYLNTVLSIWLFISAWALPTLSVGTIWNNVLVAIAIFIVSLVPGTEGSRPVFFNRTTAPPTAT